MAIKFTCIDFTNVIQTTSSKQIYSFPYTVPPTASMMALSAHVPAYRIHHSWRTNWRRDTGNGQTGVKFGHYVVVRVVVVIWLGSLLW